MLAAGGHLALISVREKLPAAKWHLALFQMEGEEEEEEVAGEEDELEMNQLIAVKKTNERKDFHQPMSTF